MCAFPSASASANWASTPVGNPRSMPIEKTCRLRTPPPTPMISLMVQGGAYRFDQRVGRRRAAVDDRAAADLDHVAVRQHPDYGVSVEAIDLLVEQTLPHQERLHMMTAISYVLVSFPSRFVPRPDAYAVMIVPTCSPFEGPGQHARFNPLMTWMERRCWAFFIRSSTLRSTTRSSRSIASSSSTVIRGMNFASRVLLGVGGVEAVLVLDEDHWRAPKTSLTR